LHVRLTTPVSSQHARVGDEVGAVMIAPFSAGNDVIAAGALVHGQVSAVESYRFDREATLALTFDRIYVGGTSFPISTRLKTVDNARETIDQNGTIKGPRTRADSGWGRLELLGLAALVPEVFAVEMGVSRVHEGVQVSVEYAAGVEMDLALLKPLAATQPPFTTPTPEASLPADLESVLRTWPTRTAAGTPPREADLLNLAFVGSRDALERTFENAGWLTAVALSKRADMKTILAILGREGYHTGPVSLESLDGLPPQVVFQKQNNTFAKRHHIRMWQRGEWRGQPLWAAAATHDVGVKFVVAERTFTHRVETDVDIERDKVTNDLLFAGAARVAYLNRASVPATITNATEDQMTTDGRLAVMWLVP
jgi:hypothetical protein